MFKKLRKAVLMLGALLAILSAGCATRSVRAYYSTGRPAPRAFSNGYYDRWGNWHPYRGYDHGYYGGYYDTWGHWHPYRWR